MPGIMSGYRCIIRQLTEEDVRIHKVDLKGVPIEECVAVDGEDLGPCVAAVIHLNKDADEPLIWSDADGKGTPIPNGFRFADSVAEVLVTLFEHLR